MSDVNFGGVGPEAIAKLNEAGIYTVSGQILCICVCISISYIQNNIKPENWIISNLDQKNLWPKLFICLFVLFGFISSYK